jgi:hypothetical protein
VLGFTPTLGQSRVATKDLKGIPPEIAQHTIPLIPGTKLVQQKNRRLNPRMQLVVKAELERLLQAGFIWPIELTDWLSHIVLVKKKGGNKLRVCVDYRDLNARTLKDHFPLPFISTIVDEVAGKALYSFMDGYSGYNQMSIAPEDIFLLVGESVATPLWPSVSVKPNTSNVATLLWPSVGVKPNTWKK